MGAAAAAEDGNAADHHCCDNTKNGRTGRGVDGAEARCVEHAAQAGKCSAEHIRGQEPARRQYAGQARGFRIRANGVHVAPGPVGGQEGSDDDEDHQADEDEVGNAEDPAVPKSRNPRGMSPALMRDPPAQK